MCFVSFYCLISFILYCKYPFTIKWDLPFWQVCYILSFIFSSVVISSIIVSLHFGIFITLFFLNFYSIKIRGKSMETNRQFYMKQIQRQDEVYIIEFIFLMLWANQNYLCLEQTVGCLNLSSFQTFLMHQVWRYLCYLILTYVSKIITSFSISHSMSKFFLQMRKLDGVEQYVHDLDCLDQVHCLIYQETQI